ncbi:MAG: aldehyde dehydrogenase family protein [Pseudomonadota bacterium]
MAANSSSGRLQIEKTYKLYIDGQFPRSESGRYFGLSDKEGKLLANISRGSRKDFRNATVAARKAAKGWAANSAYLRGQIVYRIAEMLEGRFDQFVSELRIEGRSAARAKSEVAASIDRLVYFAGWADKYQQVFSSVNPVASSHFNFSVVEPTGVVGILAPERSGLLGLISTLIPAIVGGNSCVVLASETRPLCAVSFAEVLNASDVPAGVVNILTGFRRELAGQFASHMDINAVIYCDEDEGLGRQIQLAAADNLKRVVSRCDLNFRDADLDNPYLIRDTKEVKTTWHPIGT